MLQSNEDCQLSEILSLTGMDGPEEMKARPYQAQLEEIAVSRNTIIHLPTGSGKTYIAIHLIKRFKKALQKPWGEGGKRTFFLVNNVPLVVQQKKVIEKRCPVDSVGAFSGDDGVDHWDKNKWDQELAKHQVIVMTCQILSDMLTHQYIRIEDTNVLVFDECHHAVDDHPMRMVMKHFEGCDPKKQPRVLGLTATLLNSNATSLPKVQDILRSLETTFHATIATVDDLGEVLQYSTNPNESIVHYGPLPPSSAAIEAMKVLHKTMEQVMEVRLPSVKGDPGLKLKRNEIDISTDPLKLVKALKNMLSAMMEFIADLGVYGGSLSIVAYLILLERLKKTSLTKEESLIFSFVITFASLARNILEESMEGQTGYAKIVNNSSEQIIKLLEILQEYNPDVYKDPKARLRYNKARKPISGIIFTKQRFTSKIVYNLLKEVINAKPQLYGFLKHDFIVGFNLNPMKCTREQHYTKKQSHKALLKFGNKELNLLVSTSVIEEGVDVPQCGLVLRFDQPDEYRSYMQSKGRARSSESSFVMLVKKENEMNFAKKYHNFQVIERHIQHMLVGSSDERSAPSTVEIQKKLYEDEEIPPYYNKNSGGRLSAVQAISLLNRYCSVLPRDQFTVITPTWILKHQPKTEKKIVSIILPISCPLKEPIEGMACIDLKNAKRSAALQACIKLHECDELDSFTMLPKDYGTVDFDLENVKECFPNWVEDGKEGIAKAGTKKRVRKHRKVFPGTLSGPPAWHHGQQTFYLHIIKLTPAFPEPKASREKGLYQALSQGGYGLMTSQPLPPLPNFPTYLTLGEVTTEIQVNYSKLRLDLESFETVKRFHFFVFDQVLAVAKQFLTYDGSENCLWVVPVKSKGGKLEVDTKMMTSHTEVAPVAVPSDEERKALKVTKEAYKGCIVSPWYRCSIKPDRYLVTDVLEYMTPKSNFDSDAFCTFEDYYQNKYNLDLVGPKDQPLLEVVNITSRMNCLLPRGATLRLTDKQMRLVQPRQSFTETFVPEYCNKFEYPGVMWYQGNVLPSVIHRVTRLLAADELRRRVAREANIGVESLPMGRVWKPIVTDLDVAKNSVLSEVEWPTTNNSIDRINNPIDENAPRPKVCSMKDAIYELQKKKISKEYPWDESTEPLDIERNLLSVTLMDIECYDEFVSRPAEGAPAAGPSRVRSPPSAPAPAPAIMPAPLSQSDGIELLKKTNSGIGPELKDILSALTTINSHDAFNLERSETLGDSFLKFAATLYLFHKFPKMNEGQLTNIKGRLIGNRNLYYAGERINLGGLMKVEQFSPSCDFLVPGFFAPRKVQQLIEKLQIRPTFLMGMQFDRSEILTGVISNQSWDQVVARHNSDSGEREPEGGAQGSMQGYVKAQAVSDKSVADCVEALIGTYLLSSGVPGAVKFLEWLRVIPKEDNFASYFTKHVPTPFSQGKVTAQDVDFLLGDSRREVEKRIGYTFKDPCYLLEAMSHPSYIRNRLTRSYERLEFLGDAVLDFLVTAHVFEKSKHLTPGELTDLRSALVNNVTFAAYVVRLGLHKYLCSQLNPALDGAIVAFVEHQEQRNHEILEDVLYLIDEEDCHVAEYVEVPKALSDLFESLMGAIFLDSGGDLQSVWRVAGSVMRKEIAAFSARVPLQPVRLLHEATHACPIIHKSRLTPGPVPRVSVAVTVSKAARQVTVHGVGRNKLQAKRAAAKMALRVLDA